MTVQAGSNFSSQITEPLVAEDVIAMTHIKGGFHVLLQVAQFLQEYISPEQIVVILMNVIAHDRLIAVIGA
jgi:hypothetical protein